MLEDPEERRLIDAFGSLKEVLANRGSVDRSGHAHEACPLIRDSDKDAAVDRAATDESAGFHPRNLMREAGAIPLQRSPEVVLPKLAAAQLDQSGHDPEVLIRQP